MAAAVSLAVPDAFRTLGARPDVDRLTALTGGPPSADNLSEREREGSRGPNKSARVALSPALDLSPDMIKVAGAESPSTIAWHVGDATSGQKLSPTALTAGPAPRRLERSEAASWLGGAPNWRRYSRLNCDGLS